MVLAVATLTSTLTLAGMVMVTAAVRTNMVARWAVGWRIAWQQWRSLMMMAGRLCPSRRGRASARDVTVTVTVMCDVTVTVV
jgi:hypothetical protein